MRRSLLLLLAVPLAALADEKPIQDNSFLVEEAYNQEDGVVQHINTFQRMRDTGDWVYTFTQEWPVGGLKHQFSYTLPVVHVADAPDGNRSGIGDIALNYRYQLVGDGDAKVAIAPRFSVLLPSGSEEHGRGLGATSYQGLVPVSIVLSPSFVAHSNIGYSWTPHAKDGAGNKADIGAVNLGQSLVWLATERVNFLVEGIYAKSQQVSGPGRTRIVETAFVSPGVRWAYNFPSGLQIVPGIAFPIGVGPSRHQDAVFLYLSFEHPFGKAQAR